MASSLGSASGAGAGQYLPAFNDFENVRASVFALTVDRLKSTIRHFNTEFLLNIRISGLKNDFITRIIETLQNFRASGAVEKYGTARDIINQMRSGGFYARPASGSGPAQAAYAPPPALHRPPAPALPPKPSAYGYTAPSAYGAGAGPGVGSSYGAGGYGGNARLTFKPSPFYKVVQQVSDSILTLVEAREQERKTSQMSFTLPDDVRSKLLASKNPAPSTPRYQLRLYCTSSDHYRSYAGSSSASTPHPIEFPATCEVKVNGQTLPANLRGIKKQPGTAPPADVDGAGSLRWGIRDVNRVEVTYMNAPKKYYLVVNLVEVSSVEQAVERAKTGRFIAKEEVVRSLQQDNEDDDIQTGASSLSLKCPLSFIRIRIPLRSVHASSIQCFDAETFFSINEQTPTFLDPVSNKRVGWDELAVDGFTWDILKSVPDSVDSVIVEPDGQWHTDDGKYGSPAWLEAHQSQKQSTTASASARLSLLEPIKAEDGEAPASNGKGRASEAIVLDSSDDESSAPAPAARPRASNGIGHGRPPPREVIDLTLSSDDEDYAPPPAPAVKRPRPSEDAGAQAQVPPEKRARLDVGQGQAGPQTQSFSSSSSSSSSSHPPPPRTTYAERPPSSRTPNPNPASTNVSPKSSSPVNPPATVPLPFGQYRSADTGASSTTTTTTPPRPSSSTSTTRSPQPPAPLPNPSFLRRSFPTHHARPPPSQAQALGQQSQAPSQSGLPSSSTTTAVGTGSGSASKGAWLAARAEELGERRTSAPGSGAGGGGGFAAWQGGGGEFGSDAAGGGRDW